MKLDHFAAVCRSKSNTKVNQLQDYSTEDFNTNSNPTFVWGGGGEIKRNNDNEVNRRPDTADKGPRMAHKVKHGQERTNLVH